VKGVDHRPHVELPGRKASFPRIQKLDGASALLAVGVYTRSAKRSDRLRSAVLGADTKATFAAAQPFLDERRDDRGSLGRRLVDRANVIAVTESTQSLGKVCRDFRLPPSSAYTTFRRMGAQAKGLARSASGQFRSIGVWRYPKPVLSTK
jgi:hypothetical protein